MTICNRFVVFTRGRTGSTAIVDEIDSHSDVACLQEPFIPLRGIKTLVEILEQGNVDYVEVARDRRFLHFEFWLTQWKNIFGSKLYWKGMKLRREKGVLKEYLSSLEKAEEVSLSGRSPSFGFKLLVNHLDNWPSLKSVLREDNYKVIYLERKNAVRQVLSGIIAQKRGVYNRKAYKADLVSYEVDLDDFEMRVKSEVQLVEQEKESLQESGLDLLVVTYEDFLGSRDAFLREVFDFIGVEFELPSASDYSIMIKDLRGVIVNYDDLLQRVDGMGMKHFLEA